jgi:signal transduction histidine kinase/HAMP domain-containing protein
MGKRRLRFKINISIMAAAVILVGFFFAFFYPYQERQHHRRMEEIRVLLNAVYDQRREELANEMFAGQTGALAASLNEMMTVPGVVALNVYRLDGQPLLSTMISEIAGLPSRERSLLNQRASFEKTAMADRAFAEFGTAVEVIGERVGYLKIQFDLAELERDARASALLVSGGLIVVIAIMSLALNLMLSRSVLRPVQALQGAIRKLRQGVLGEQVEVITQDEIGEMAAAFNGMSTQLETQHRRLAASMKARDEYFAKMEQSHQALEKLNTELESRVEERTMQLRSSYEKLRAEIVERERTDQEKKILEERLARSRKMEALGLLAGGVAHDLNNVLSGIVSYPDLLLMELPADSRMRRPIETIQDSGQKAAAIVQDLLTLARRGVTHTEVINFNDDVVLDYLKSAEHEKLLVFHPSVRIQTRLSGDIYNIRGSVVHLRKTVMNLISNAAEAQPDGGEITIATENRYVEAPLPGYEQVEEGEYVVLGVADRGIGIASEDLNRIFEPFYTKKVMGRSGTGLGMAVVWGTVQDHQGYIDVVSTPGKGTTFEIFFPVVAEEKAARKQTASLDLYMGHGETILVVDDVAQQREISAKLLEKLDYSVVTVESGEQAVAYMKTHRPDLLVLDMIMDPGIDGLETYRRIKSRVPGQKAVIASGFAENNRVRQAQALGVGAYIRKPYTLEKIGRAVQAELRR